MEIPTLEKHSGVSVHFLDQFWNDYELHEVILKKSYESV